MSDGRLWARVASMVRRVRMLGSDASGAAQVARLDGGESAEMVEPYGLTSRAEAGAEALVIAPGGDLSQAVVLQVADRRRRPRDVEPGNVTLWNAAGVEVRLTGDGVAIKVGGGRLQVQSLDEPNVGLNSGLVHGSGMDPFTGLSYFALGSTTAQVQAEKT